MAKKKAKARRKVKARKKDLAPRKTVKGGVMTPRLGIRGPSVFSAV